MTKGPLAREIVFEALTEILEENRHCHTVLAKALDKYRYLEKTDRSLIKRMVNGTVEYRLTIDHILNLYSKVKTEKMKPAIRTILRMSAYQILYLDRVPDFAVCNEAVKLAGRRGFRGLSGFVNGVLRAVSRDKEKLSFEEPCFKYSMPAWIFAMWEEELGGREAARLCESFLEGRPLMVRCNRSRASAQEILTSLAGQGVTARDMGAGVFSLSGVDYPEALEAFQKGWIQIQDLSSALAGEAAGFKEGDTVLDVCGAPGGKSVCAADHLKGSGLVVCRDLTEGKVSLIEDTIRRSGFANIQAGAWDALCFDPEWEGRADVVIADLPCSGLGIIGRKPDIKYHASPERIRELAALQREILDVVWRYVKPGGTLVYSTCTISRRENQENRSWFLENHPFEPADIRERLGEDFTQESLREGYVQLLPGTHPCDGFFIAVMRRRAGLAV